MLEPTPHPKRIMMASSTVMTPAVAMPIPSTATALAHCTSTVSSTETRNASTRECPVRGISSANQGSRASGAAASFSMMRPKTIIAAPKSGAASGRYRAARSLTSTAPASPSAQSATAFASSVTMNTSVDTPTQPPRMIVTALPTSIMPERRMLTTMKVRAGMLWVMLPASAPHSSADPRLPIQVLTAQRSRRLASVLRLSVSRRIPTMNRPRPPMAATT